MEQRQPFGPYQEVDHESLQARRRDWLVWLVTSLAVSIVPFLLIALIYRAGFETPQHSHGFPTFSTLFGEGDLLLVILSVTGATFAEFWLYPDHLRSLRKSAALAASGLIALTAGGMSTAIAYAAIIGKEDQFDHGFVAVLSASLLVMVVVIQSVILLTRRGTIQ
jgi:hypothetical protein